MNMDLDLNTYNKDMSAEERKASSIFKRVQISGPLADDEAFSQSFLAIMEEIFLYYEFDSDCVLKLKNEFCDNCGYKLTRKGEFQKEITLPGGSSIFLDFYRYSCSNCKEPVDRKLDNIFEPNKQYSRNLKADAVRLYSKHLSSYDAVTEELNKLYCTNLSKKTVISWLEETGLASEQVTLNDNDFSGYLVYDEEFIKVFDGDVGIKNSKLQWVDHYLLLFRDAITQKVIVKFSDDLSEESLFTKWKEVFLHLYSKGIEVKAFGTDGKREYKKYIRKFNQKHGFNIQHVYDAFHFSKNLYESANEEVFGVKQTKKKLPEVVINQIKVIQEFFSVKNMEEADKKVKQLVYEENTFIRALRKHIFRLRNYFSDYTYFLKVPEMKTTDLCEGWFSRTKPKKIKREYKTRKGIKSIANMLAVRINYEWASMLNLNFDFSIALNGLLGMVKAKYQ